MGVKMWNFIMHLNFSYQLKIGYYKLFYLRLMVTTKQKHTVDTKQIHRKESKHTSTEYHQITKE